MPFIEHAGKRLLYLHVPRTGGGSVERWLAGIAPLRFRHIGLPPALRCTPQHLRLSDFRQLFGDGYFDHVVMTVRDPFRRIESEYRLRAAIAGQGFWKESPDFSFWLEQSLDRARNEPFLFDNHLRPQWQFGGTGVEVLRFEDGMSAILGRIAAILGVAPPADVPHENAAPSVEGLKVDWDEVDRIRVAETYARDFTQFGYEPAQ